MPGAFPAERRVSLHMRDSVDGVFDGAITRAAAEIAFHRRAQIPALRLSRLARGQHHPRRAKAALKTLRGEKVVASGAVVSRQTLDRCHRAALGAERRRDAAMHRLTVQQHRASPAIAGVAAFFHAEPAEFAQECA